MSGLFLGELALTAVDVDAYCARVGFGGPRTPTLSTLRELCWRQAAAIPFEALDVRLGRAVSLAPEAVDEKLIARRRGGYCFEQNTLLLRALRTLGFEAEPLIARSRWRRPLEERVARTHMAVRVRLAEGDWLADTGFGACTLTAPLELSQRGPQATRHEPARLVPVGDAGNGDEHAELRLERLLGSEWAPLYDLVLAPQAPVDLLAANWLISTHPASSFRHRLVVSRARDEVRHVLVDTRLTIRRDGGVEHRELDAAGLERSLREDFGLSVEPGWRALFEELAAR